MLRHRLASVVAVLLVAIGAAAIEPAAGFARIEALAGDWEAKSASGAIVRVSYRPIAKGSAMVQTYRVGSGGETMTIFHPDGARLLATHYCAQGNQPRLKLDAASTSDRLIFTFLDVTNLSRAEAAHLVRLELRFEGPDVYTSVETYEENGKPESTTSTFHRVN